MHLRCNLVSCRTVLNQNQACVTTCSHIFCLSCSQNSFEKKLQCPVCRAPLLKADDIKCIEPEPSEQLLTSILSGYSPLAMNKALQYGMQFWMYQMEQEMMFSQHQLKEYHTKQKESDAQIESINKTNAALIQQYEDQCQKLSDLLKQERAQKSLLEDQLKQFERDRARNSYDSFNNQWQSGGKSKGFNFSNVTPKTPFLKYQSHSMNDLSIDPPKFD